MVDSSSPACRACRGQVGQLVLDLGLQPACDRFPAVGVPGPDPAYPLQMWLCAVCGLAQLSADSTTPAEPRGTEPAALAEQATDAVRRVVKAGLLPSTGTAAEYSSPHGGSWLGLLSNQGLNRGAGDSPADVVVDCFGMMHAADQAAALAERARRVAEPSGLLLMQYHSLSAIIRRSQWNVLRHGHFAYYSTTVLAAMLAFHGFRVAKAWQFELYGGTVLLAAKRETDNGLGPDPSLRPLLAEDARVGVRQPDALRGLQRESGDQSSRLHSWLSAQRSAGRLVLGYGAASRAVALLCKARIDRSLLPAVADASPTKQGLRMPGTDIPIVSVGELVSRRPHAILLLVPDLRAEVRAAYPAIEQAGTRWVDTEEVGLLLHRRRSGGL